MLAVQSFFGFFVLYGVAWLCSEHRAGVQWRTVLSALLLQFVLALLLFKFPYFHQGVLVLNDALGAIQKATGAGTALLFGYLGGGELPFEVQPGKSAFVLAIQTLPVVVVISALASLLFYLRILPWVVRVFSWVLARSIGIGGALGLSTAANIFLGPVESPLFIKPYLDKLSRGELFAVMVGGMSGIAGTMMVLYGLVLQNSVPGAIGHLLIASFISAPAAIAVSALMVPHVGRSTAVMPALSSQTAPEPEEAQSAMDAIARGTIEGMQMLINIVAMVLVLTALIALVNLTIEAINPGAQWTLQRLFGLMMAPLAWLIGVPGSEAQTVGSLLGTKTVLNEYLAYLDLIQLAPGVLSPRSQLLATYALCSFANLGSLGIMIGGLGTLCPNRRSEIIQLGYRCVFGGTLATLSGAALIGVIY